MRVPEPILTTHLFEPVNAALVELLRGLTPDEWNAPTAAGSWTVRDVVAHLLDTTLRRLSAHRDAHLLPLPPGAFNEMNAIGVAALRRFSPRVLIELHATYGAQMAEFFVSLDPFADAKWGVSWAGEERSQNWFDIAREFTERWHHQQQIRDATGRPLLDHLDVVLDTFMRALPFAYRDVDAPRGTEIVVNDWTLVREDGWRLYAGASDDPATRVTIAPERAWKIFTRQKIDAQARVEGDARYAEGVLKMVSVL